MELKDFKAGVETLARFTNQRLSEPDPFLFQVGKDGGFSLISGNDKGIAVWRTGTSMMEPTPMKHGINSKTLVQAAKVLKGRGVSVHFKLADDHLEVFTSPAGGSIKLPFGEKPELHARPMDGEYVQFDWTADEFETFLAGVEASHAKSYPDGLVVEAGNVGYHRLASTDRYIMWQGKKHSANNKSLAEPVVVSASFWNALRKFNSNAVTRFYQSGVKTLLGNFEFSTGFLGAHPIWPNIEDRYFKPGTMSDVTVWLNRKALIGSVKAVLPAGDPEATTIALSYDAERRAFVHSVKTNETVQTATARGQGTGRCEVSGKFILNILNAISDESVIVSWNNEPQYPIRIVGSKTLWSSFVLAPVIRV
jgi:hypothetical protein